MKQVPFCHPSVLPFLSPPPSEGNHILPCPFSGVYWGFIFSYDPLDRRAHPRPPQPCVLFAFPFTWERHICSSWIGGREEGHCPTVSPVERGFSLVLAVIPSSKHLCWRGWILDQPPLFRPQTTQKPQVVKWDTLSKPFASPASDSSKIYFLSLQLCLHNWNEALKASNLLSFSFPWIDKLILLFIYQTSHLHAIRSIWVENHFTHHFSKADVTFSGWLKGNCQ